MYPDQDTSGSPTDAQQDSQDLDVTSSAATSTAADDNLDSSPDGDTAEAEQSLQDVITEAAGGNNEDSDYEAEDSEQAAEEGQAPKGETPEGDAKAEDDAKAETESQTEDEEDTGEDVEEGQKIPYQRFKKVIDQRNEWKEKTQTLEQERDQYKQGHEQFQSLQSFMQESKLTNEDVAETLHIAGLFNSDPKQAAALLEKKLQTLHRLTGDVLPEDLQEQVEVGEISEARAKEIAELRVSNARTQQQYQELTQAQQQEQMQRQQQQVRSAMATAADTAQQELVNSDPDYERKAPWVRKELQLLIQAEKPQTAEDAARLVKQAHSNVTKELAKLAPKPQVRPGPSSAQGRGSSNATREPSSMADAIRMAAQQAAE